VLVEFGVNDYIHGVPSAVTCGVEVAGERLA